MALSEAQERDDTKAEVDRSIDPDFEGWLHGIPLVTKNLASRYGDLKTISQTIETAGRGVTG